MDRKVIAAWLACGWTGDCHVAALLAMTEIGRRQHFDLTHADDGSKGERIATASVRTGFAMTGIGRMQRFDLTDTDVGDKGKRIATAIVCTGFAMTGIGKCQQGNITVHIFTEARQRPSG